MLGWVVAAGLLVALAFVVGGPAAEQGLLGSRSSSTPSAPAAIPIRFGLALDPDTNRAVRRVRQFHTGQRFAYSVTLPRPSDESAIFVEVERIAGGTPEVVQERSIQRITAGQRTFAFVVRTDDLLAAWGPGRFEMRIFMDGETAPIAVGRFTLVAETPS